jgi:ceramide glucosyltransferase
VLAILETILVVLILAYILYIVCAHFFTWHYFRRYDLVYRPSGHMPPVSIIKPVKGLDPFALENFRSFCEQDYAIGYEVLFCVDDLDDPSVPLVKRLIDEYPDRKIRLIFAGRGETRAVGKIKKMIAGLAASSYEVAVFSNADVRIGPGFLKETIGRIDDPRIGLAITASAYEGADDCAAACWNISTAALAIRLASACLFGLLDVVDGKIMVIRKAVVAEIGGLEQFGRQADDAMTLARAVRRHGYGLHLLKQPARVVHPHDSWAGWWSHWHRWLVVSRRYLPAAAWPLAFTQVPLWWSLLYIAMSVLQGRSVRAGLVLTTAVIAVDVISAVIINTKFVRDRKMWRFIWVVPILELSSLPLLLRSCLTNEVVWRGTRLRVNRDCTVTELGP